MQYRPDIDGLRAVAVLSVMAYHTGIALFGGGMGGVDVFFVISGFLITTIIFEDISKGRFSFGNFFERRVRRILPPLFFMLIAALPFIVLIHPDPDRDYNIKLLLSAAFSGGNIFLANLDGFTPKAGLDPLAHTWSLGVEEQFYLVFPVFLCLLWRVTNKWTWAGLLIVAIGSFIWACIETADFQEPDFFVPHLRAWELLIGALLSFLMRSYVVPAAAAEIVALAGLTMVVFTVFFLPEHVVNYPGPLTIIPTMGAAAIILSGARNTLVRRALSWQPLVYVGMVSYSLYLWHQPIFEFGKLLTNTGWNMGIRRAIVFSVLSIAVAHISWRFIETPFRRRDSVVDRFRLIAMMAACLGLLTISSLVFLIL